MIDLSSTVTHLHHCIGLTTDAHLDSRWWLEFLPHWSGTSLILNNRWTPSRAYWDSRWIQSHWSPSPSQKDMDIAWKEMYAIVLAVHTSGSFWAR